MPLIIQERFGLVVGSVPPFGPLLNIETFFDERVPLNERAAFNCGMLTELIIMRSKDLINLVQPKFGRFAKE